MTLNRIRRPISTLSLTRRSGLTLIELVVVITILTAIGGLLVPVIGGMMSRTHFAKCAVTIPDLTRQISRSFTGNLRYPNRWDSLISNVDGTSLYPNLPGGPSVSGELATLVLNVDQANGLNAIGMTQLVDLEPTVFAGGIAEDATWESAPLGQASVRQIATGESVAVLNKLGPSAVSLNLKRHFGPDGVAGSADDDPFVEYMVFGVGSNCTAVGPSGLFVEAPTHFGGEDVMNPIDVYQRYCVIFSTDAEGNILFETACSVHPEGFDGGEAHVRGFYQETRE
ncbi:MAG: type II secretion system protein [Planctomycetota bacterium]